MRRLAAHRLNLVQVHDEERGAIHLQCLQRACFVLSARGPHLKILPRHLRMPSRTPYICLPTQMQSRRGGQEDAETRRLESAHPTPRHGQRLPRGLHTARSARRPEQAGSRLRPPRRRARPTRRKRQRAPAPPLPSWAHEGTSGARPAQRRAARPP